MSHKLGSRFWSALVIFGLTGQIAWVVENMYFNVFIYKMFHASAANISFMVSASAVAAAITTILIGALSDKIGKRKLIMSLGYILWGVSIMAFAGIRVDVLSGFAATALQAASLGITLTIIMDCVMTFFGSSANDAAYNAWLTDRGDETNRGRIEGMNSIFPLVAILVVFGGFMGFDLDLPESWTRIFLIIGGLVIIIGLLGFFLIDEANTLRPNKAPYWETVLYSFRPSVCRQNGLLYLTLAAFAVFGISIQIFMPYLILYYEKSLGMDNYVLIMAPAILLAAVVTALYGKVFDRHGFKAAILPSLLILCAGYILLFFTRTTIPVFIGSLLMMSGYLTGMTVFGAMIRENIPSGKAGQFQGIRIIGQVLIPGIIGPAIGAAVLANAEQILNDDGTYSFLPNRSIFAAALGVIILLLLFLFWLFRKMRSFHNDLHSQYLQTTEFRREGGRHLREYPRMQMRRASYQNLNGYWTCNGSDILVPYPPESSMSGFQGKVMPHLVYERKFMPDEKSLGTIEQCRTLLHFGAVDQVCTVYLNDQEVGSHEGGYLPFTFDVTGHLKYGAENVLRIDVTDTLDPTYPYGKQRKNRGGMWYTPVSGIWQSVWLEAVPPVYIKDLQIDSDCDGVTLTVRMSQPQAEPPKADIQLHGHGHISTELKPVTGTEKGTGEDPAMSGSVFSGHIDLTGRELTDGIAYEPRRWTPEEPYLYSMLISCGEDQVESYFALRSLTLEEGRLQLNGNPVFLHGVLDQGYFCDGIYTPASYSEYEQDIKNLKQLGFNMLRKHIKVEPDYFYYLCDLHGMLVVQDMVESGTYSFLKDTALPFLGKMKKDDRVEALSTRHTIFEEHVKGTIRHLSSHPSIIMWTIFNEGWGQFDSDRFYDMVKELDPGRLVDSTSGWFAMHKSDFDSRHIYFKKAELKRTDRPVFLSECGGFSMPAEGHIFSQNTSYGYGTCKNSKELTDRICGLYKTMVIPAIKEGLCGCVYTQISDVEDEINGLYTYDRQLCKVDSEQMRRIAREIQEATVR